MPSPGQLPCELPAAQHGSFPIPAPPPSPNMLRVHVPGSQANRALIVHIIFSVLCGTSRAFAPLLLLLLLAGFAPALPTALDGEPTPASQPSCCQLQPGTVSSWTRACATLHVLVSPWMCCPRHRCSAEFHCKGKGLWRTGWLEKSWAWEPGSSPGSCHCLGNLRNVPAGCARGLSHILACGAAGTGGGVSESTAESKSWGSLQSSASALCC